MMNGKVNGKVNGRVSGKANESARERGLAGLAEPTQGGREMTATSLDKAEAKKIQGANRLREILRNAEIRILTPAIIEDSYGFYEQRMASPLKSFIEARIEELEDFYSSTLEEGINKNSSEHLKLPPILVAKTPNGKYVVIDGVLRLEAIKRVGRTSVRAKVVDLEDLDDIGVYILRAYANGGHGVPLDKEFKQKLVRLLYSSGYPIKRIAELTRIPQTTLYRWTKDLRDRKKNIDIEAIAEQVDNGKTITEIAKEVGVSPATISRRLKAFRLSKSKEASHDSNNASLDELSRNIQLNDAENTISEQLEDATYTTSSSSPNPPQKLSDFLKKNFNYDDGSDFSELVNELGEVEDTVCVKFTSREEFEESFKRLLQRVKQFLENEAKEDGSWVHDVVLEAERAFKEVRRKTLGTNRKLDKTDLRVIEFIEKRVSGVKNKYALVKKVRSLAETAVEAFRAEGVKISEKASTDEAIDIVLSIYERYADPIPVGELDSAFSERISDLYAHIRSLRFIDPIAEGLVYSPEVRSAKFLSDEEKGEFEVRFDFAFKPYTLPEFDLSNAVPLTFDTYKNELDALVSSGIKAIYEELKLTGSIDWAPKSVLARLIAHKLEKSKKAQFYDKLVQFACGLLAKGKTPREALEIINKRLRKKTEEKGMKPIQFGRLPLIGFKEVCSKPIKSSKDVGVSVSELIRHIPLMAFLVANKALEVPRVYLGDS